MRPAAQLLPRHARFLAGLAAGLVLPAPAVAAPPHPPDEAVRRRLGEVLARPEFSDRPSFLLPVWLQQLLARLFGWLGSLYQTAPGLYWVLLVGCVVLLLLIAAHVIWTVYRVFFVSDRGPGGESDHERRQRLSGTYREEARRQAERGEYTEAIRYLFLALVYRLDESGRVLFPRAFTNREYLALFADRPALQSQLTVFVDTLDDHWYGQHPTDRVRYEDCLGRYDAVERGA